MLQSFVIMFRETLEAALVVGIVLAYLGKIGQTRHNRWVYLGIAAGVAGSLAGAFLFQRLAGGFEGRAEQVFEGLVMAVGAGLLTTMILWMMRRAAGMAADVRRRVDQGLSASRGAGLFLLVFVSILREGIEAVIFLGAARFASQGNNLAGALLGLAAAVVLGYLITAGALRINLHVFFTVVNVVLILFAAGLIAHGVHELQEAGWLPTVVEHIWDINPRVAPGGAYPLLHENGYIGSLARGLFGYNGNPSLLEVILYAAYLLAAVGLWVRIEGRGGAPRGR